MKVALFYDWLNQWGGAEKVFLNLIKIYPQADIYTLVYDSRTTSWLPPHLKIHTSFINNLPFANKNPIIYTPLYALALEQFDFSQYDLVIATTSVIGHCLITPPQTLFCCYYHNINRHLYQNHWLSFYQPIDKIYSARPDVNFCNSQTVQTRIKNYLHKSAKIIYPGIDTAFFTPTTTTVKKHFLIVSRLVHYKKVEIAIQACQNLHQKLIIVGTGRYLTQLQKISNPKYISFTGAINNQQLVKYYQQAHALICPQIEDFGLAPIESMSCGTPVIAYNSGGITETVINGLTGLFFDYQNSLSLQNCLIKFKKTKFNTRIIRQHALKFSDKQFMINFKKEINTLWKKHPNI